MTSTSLQPAALLLAFLGGLSGCAHTPVAAAPATATTPTMLVTGSRIPRPVDPITGRVVTESPVRVYSAQELNATGSPSRGGALRLLDPSFH
jgi:hypothetical protein